jgi:hypothetical protein
MVLPTLQYAAFCKSQLRFAGVGMMEWSDQAMGRAPKCPFLSALQGRDGPVAGTPADSFSISSSATTLKPALELVEQP